MAKIQGIPRRAVGVQTSGATITRMHTCSAQKIVKHVLCIMHSLYACTLYHALSIGVPCLGVHDEKQVRPWKNHVVYIQAFLCRCAASIMCVMRFVYACMHVCLVYGVHAYVVQIVYAFPCGSCARGCVCARMCMCMCAQSVS
jgi:hypothetical protein